jgi:hypothetical protein
MSVHRTLTRLVLRIAVLVVACGTATADALSWVYVAPNSGGSSGGHAAACFAERCFHFQQVDDARIRLRRDDFEKLDFDYRVLGNRSLHVSHVAVSTSDAARLKDAFDRRLVAETIAFDRLDDRRDDRLLLERLAAPAPSPFELAGAGYFVADDSDGSPRWWPAGAARAAPIDALRALVAARFGDDFLDRRAADLRAQIARLVPPSAADEAVGEAGFATRHHDLLEALVAVEVLRAAPPLRAGSLVDAGALAPGEAQALQAFAARLRAAMLEVLDSPRPDRGKPLLVGLARLLAVEASLDAGSLLVLDVLARDAPVVPAEQVVRHRAAVEQVAVERRADLARLRASFFSDPGGSEARWSLLEVAATLAAEMEHGVAAGRPIRLHRGAPLPLRGARRADWPRPSLAGVDVERALDLARQREATVAAELDAGYAYDLFERNCVTEIFHTIDTALAGGESAADAPAASEAALGGWVDGQAGWNFVPAVSARAVDASYAVIHREQRPSYRRATVRRMRAVEPSWRVAVREGNVLTARSYRPNPDDPAFLLFSDDAGIARPLFGAVNLAWGAGASVVGAALAPVDRAALLRAGVEGMLYSLPELAFVSVRKGTYAFAPRAWADWR